MNKETLREEMQGNGGFLVSDEDYENIALPMARVIINTLVKACMQSGMICPETASKMIARGPEHERPNA